MYFKYILIDLIRDFSHNLGINKYENILKFQTGGNS